jgi:hypothetical protein
LPIGTRFTISPPEAHSPDKFLMERVEDTPAGTLRAKYIVSSQYQGETICKSKYSMVYPIYSN